jgi:hypothetical protein
VRAGFLLASFVAGAIPGAARADVAIGPQLSVATAPVEGLGAGIGGGLSARFGMGDRASIAAGGCLLRHPGRTAVVADLTLRYLVDEVPLEPWLGMGPVAAAGYGSGIAPGFALSIGGRVPILPHLSLGLALSYAILVSLGATLELSAGRPGE